MNVAALLSIEHEKEKYLQTFNNESIIQNVINYTKKLNFVKKVIIITDDNYFEKYSDQIDEIFYTRKSDSRCESERVYKFFQKDSTFDYYISIPTLDPSIKDEELNNKWENIEKYVEPEGVATFYTGFNVESDIRNTKFSKVVMDEDNALYFSRAPIPLKKNGSLADMGAYKRALDLFVFPKKLLKYLGSELWGEWTSPLADTEELQQNRFLEFGLPVHVEYINHLGFQVENESDIQLLKQRTSNQ